MILRDENGFIKSIVLTGRPGIGKSHVLRDYLTKRGIEIEREHVVVFSLSEMSDPDSIGCYPIPFTKDGPDNFRIINVIQQDQLTPLLERNIGERYGVLILDDVTGAPPQVQNTLLNLVQFRNIGGNKLGKNVFIGLTGNNVDDDANATSWNQALVDRCMFVEFEPNLESWIELKCNREIHPAIVYFLKENPKFFAPRGTNDEVFTTDRNNKAPSPRSWTSLGVALQQLNGIQNFVPDEIFSSSTQFISSYIGEQAAKKMMIYCEHLMKFPSSEQILKNPEIWNEIPEKDRDRSILKYIFIFGIRGNYQRMIASGDHLLSANFIKAIKIIALDEPEKISMALGNVLEFFDKNKEDKNLLTRFQEFIDLIVSDPDPKFRKIFKTLQKR